jgi:pimeloyl-ACP methyl ester carboxylesterase
VKRQKAVATLVSALTKPRDFSRFLTQAEYCLTHDAWEELPRIFCPTLIIGGTEDRIVTAEGSRELAGQIVGAELVLYQSLSHALYEEAKDFLDRVRDFCLKD